MAVAGWRPLRLGARAHCRPLGVCVWPVGDFDVKGLVFKCLRLRLALESLLRLSPPRFRPPAPRLHRGLSTAQA